MAIEVGVDYETLLDYMEADSKIVCQAHPDNGERVRVKILDSSGDPFILSAGETAEFDYKQAPKGIEGRIDTGEDDSSEVYDSSSAVTPQKIQVIY